MIQYFKLVSQQFAMLSSYSACNMFSPILRRWKNCQWSKLQFVPETKSQQEPFRTGPVTGGPTVLPGPDVAPANVIIFCYYKQNHLSLAIILRLYVAPVKYKRRKVIIGGSKRRGVMNRKFRMVHEMAFLGRGRMNGSEEITTGS